MTNHRCIQIHNLLDSVQNQARVLRRCALKATTINNRSAAIHFVGQAIKCDRIAVRCSDRLGRLALEAA